MRDSFQDRLQGLVRQVVNLRRIVNPPAALGRAATAFGESARAVCGLHTPIQAVLPMNRAAIRSPVAPAAAPLGDRARLFCVFPPPIQAVLPMNRAAIPSPVAPAAAPQLYR